ncbi:MAG: TonB-dependent receptor domain-containing protein [Cyanophyceae cyanobacterium]
MAAVLAMALAQPVSAQEARDPLLQQSQASLTQITEVRVDTTETGLNVLLETADGLLEGVSTSVIENALIVNIPNAALNLTDGDTFEIANPAAGIALIMVSNVSDSDVQIVMTGLEAPPTATIKADRQTWILGVMPGRNELAADSPTAEPEGIRIVLTAEKTSEELQDVPISVTAITRQEIEDADLTSLEAIAGNVPNFSFSPSGDRSFAVYSIRGLSNSSVIANRDPIDFYVDGIPYGFASFIDVNLPDLERVEVLRGPQNVLYGRNSIAGVVNLITLKPSIELEFNAIAGYGRFDDLDLRAGISGPLIEDELFFRLSGSYDSSDGYVRNTFLDEDVNESSRGTGRAQLLWTPSDAWEISLNVSFDDYADGAGSNVPLSQDDPFKAEQDVDGFNDLTINAQALRITYTHPDFRVTSVTARRDSRSKFGSDGDTTAADALERFVDEVSNRVFSQEIRIQSPETADRFEWLLGGYYESTQFDSRNNGFRYGADAATLGVPFPEGTLNFSNGDVNNETLAAFGQVSYRPVDALTLTAGLRYESTRSTLENFERIIRTPGLPDSTLLSLSDVEQEGDVLLPRFIAEYRFTPNLMVYGSITRGYRPPGANLIPGNLDTATYGAERSWNYEGGLKSSWLDDRLTVNLAVFHNQVDDFQVLSFDNLGSAFLANADVSITGFELEARATPTPGLSVVAGFGLVDAEFTDFNNPFTGGDSSGNQLTFSPSFSYNLAVQYRSPIGIFGRVELQGLGETFFDDANTLKQDPYAIVNARLGYETGDFGVYLFANNLFDTEYINQAFDLPPLGTIASFGSPSTYGIQVRGRF